jgi:hypothetical protein
MIGRKEKFSKKTEIKKVPAWERMRNSVLSDQKKSRRNRISWSGVFHFCWKKCINKKSNLKLQGFQFLPFNMNPYIIALSIHILSLFTSYLYLHPLFIYILSLFTLSLYSHALFIHTLFIHMLSLFKWLIEFGERWVSRLLSLACRLWWFNSRELDYFGIFSFFWYLQGWVTFNQNFRNWIVKLFLPLWNLAKKSGHQFHIFGIIFAY